MLVNKLQRQSLKARRCMTSAEEATKQRKGKMAERNKTPHKLQQRVPTFANVNNTRRLLLLKYPVSVLETVNSLP